MTDLEPVGRPGRRRRIGRCASQSTSLGGCNPETGAGLRGLRIGMAQLRIAGRGRSEHGDVHLQHHRRGAPQQQRGVRSRASIGGTSRVTLTSRINSTPAIRAGNNATVGLCPGTRRATDSNDDEVPTCSSRRQGDLHDRPRGSRRGVAGANPADDNLEARVQRAVEVTDFEVRVRPDESTKGDRGCNLLVSFTMQGGEDGEVERALEGIPTGSGVPSST